MLSFSADKHQKLLRIVHISCLIILGFIIIAVAITLSNRNKYLSNNTDWFENYFENPENKLSNAQKSIIRNSVAIISSVNEDNGVKVTLDSVTGNGYCTYYKVDIELPKGTNTGYDYVFDKRDLLLNDDSAALNGSGGSAMTIEDENPSDNLYSLLITTRLGYYSENNYSFADGTVRTLHLEDLIPMGKLGEKNKIKGSWDFNIIFKNKGKFVGLIDKPTKAKGFSYLEQNWYDAEITSFSVSEFSARCQYKMSQNSTGRTIGISPVAVMKDGRSFRLVGIGGSSTYYDYYFNAPISFDEVDYIKLTDDVIVPF